jgi:hypothetical protein
VIQLIATAAIFSCLEFHTMVEKVMATNMSAEQKAAVITELAAVTEFGCQREVK